ncbi:MAG: prepilin-type N-terminal cleavage/methylation domain-containing protein [Gemmatimonadota bacterium]|nr:prepilin-type N-terminal cleavage/methylation domain-containing protein [Gemmatimonadota bacterium]MDH5197135.1 prepilin-type N-terminal cleavage/methylation domain-containing protein [Gemmatimonadota bacterium]
MTHRVTTQRRFDPHGTRGVSLVELLTVVVIIGVMVAIALPRIDVSRYRVNSAMQTAGLLLISAQQQAVTRQHDFVVGFDAPNGSIRVHQDANNDGKIDAGERVRNWPLGDNVVFGRGGAPAFAIGQPAVTFTQVREGLPSVIFHRSGSASEYGGFYLTSRRSALGGLSRDARAIEVERATGRATWYRYVNQWSKDF